MNDPLLKMLVALDRRVRRIAKLVIASVIFTGSEKIRAIVVANAGGWMVLEIVEGGEDRERAAMELHQKRLGPDAKISVLEISAVVAP